MSKDTFYFSHDYNSRNDHKIKRLISKHGYQGYGLFWAIIEDLYNNTNVLRLDYDSISFDLRCDIEMIKSIINDFDLFVFDGETFGSLSVQRRIDERNEKSKKARESILKRWEKKKTDTNVLQAKYDSNTIKERKGKENKGKENKENKDVALPLPDLSDYQLCVDFWLKEFHLGWDFKGQQGKALKSIITKLKTIIKDQATIYDTFRFVCINLPEWYKQKDLQVIDSKFNEIITEIKNKSNGTITNNGKSVSKYHN